jgi:hypothetical protein
MIRASLKLINKVFNMRDQEIFKLFKNIKVDKDLVNIKSIEYSILPKDGFNIDEFDF